MKKKIIIASILGLFVQLASAQVGSHDYLTIHWEPNPIMRTLWVNATGYPQRSIDLRTLNGKNPEPGADWMTALALVQEYEGLGYELFDFSAYGLSETRQGENWVWLMRKPKQ